MNLHPSIQTPMKDQRQQPEQPKTHLHPSIYTLHAQAQANAFVNDPDRMDIESTDYYAAPSAPPFHQTASNADDHPAAHETPDVALENFDLDIVDWDSFDLSGIDPAEYGLTLDEPGNEFMDQMDNVIVPGTPPLEEMCSQDENPFGISNGPHVQPAFEVDLNAARAEALEKGRQHVRQQQDQQISTRYPTHEFSHLQAQPSGDLGATQYLAQQQDQLLGQRLLQQPGYRQIQDTHDSVLQPSQYPIQHPQHLVQQFQTPVQQYPINQPRQQQPPQAQKPARVQPATPAIAPAPKAPVNITSHAEAQQAAATRHIPHDWQPLRNDTTFPHDQAAQDAYLRQLITAFTDITHCLNKEKGAHFTARWEHISTGHSIYTPQQIETVCRKLLSIAIDLHTSGPSALNTLDTVKLKNVWKTRRLDFAERIADMCELLRLSKARCETLLGWEGLGMVVGTPGLLGTQTRRNRENNEGRQGVLELGREAKGRMWTVVVGE